MTDRDYIDPDWGVDTAGKPLKPCPFCGGSAELSLAERSALIKCTACKAQTRIVMIDARYGAIDKATELWNGREKINEG